jgi:hypothetical protein
MGEKSVADYRRLYAQPSWARSKSASSGAGRRTLGGFPLRSSFLQLAEVREGEDNMLYTLAVILLIAWLLGVVGTYTIGAFVHVLLVIAIVLFIVGLLSGRRTVV